MLPKAVLIMFLQMYTTRVLDLGLGPWTGKYNTNDITEETYISIYYLPGENLNCSEYSKSGQITPLYLHTAILPGIINVTSSVDAAATMK